MLPEPDQARLRLVKWTVLLVAHGTVRSLDELPDFVTEIRHGRPAPPELIQELRGRYEAVGGSPLLQLTEELAEAVAARTGLETRIAMRLWQPRVEQVLADRGPEDQILLVPLAPFSVKIYEAAARRALTRHSSPPTLHAVRPWGSEERLVQAWAEGVRALDPEEGRAERVVLLSAHSLPRFVIEQGDAYAREFEQAARAVERILGRPCRIVYQSQGALSGEWLGPDLRESMQQARDEGARSVLVAPIGFLSEHIETLYDLDIEAKKQAEELGLGFSRAPTLNSHPELVETIAALIREVQDRATRTN